MCAKLGSERSPPPPLGLIADPAPPHHQVRAEIRSLRRTGCSFETTRPQGRQQGRGQQQGGEQQHQEGQEGGGRSVTGRSSSIGGEEPGAGSRVRVPTPVPALGPARSLQAGMDRVANRMAGQGSAPAKTNVTAAAALAAATAATAATSATAAAAAEAEGTAWHRTAGLPSWDSCFRCHFLSCGRYSGPYNAKV